MEREAGIRRMLADIEAEVRLTRGAIGKSTLDPAVMRAMEEVPRDRFVPLELAERAYDNGPLPIGSGQTISQPYMVALMTDLLRVGPGDRVLEVGTGSGYQSAVLSRVVATVYTIEIVKELGVRAHALFEEMGYGNIESRIGDGSKGWPEQAPFDGIIVTASARRVPSTLVEQLRPGARLVIPVGEMVYGQELEVVEKSPDGQVSKRPVLGVSFVPMTGDY